MTYSNIKGESMGIAFAALVLLTLAFTPVSANAADMLSYDFYPEMSSYDFYPEQSYDFYPEQSYDFYPEQSYDSYGYDSYGYSSYPSYSSSYYTPSQSYYTPGNSYSSSAASAVSSVYAPSNTEVCNAPNSCNTNYDDHSVFNAPTVVTVTDYSNTNDDNDDYDHDNKKHKKYNRDYDYDYDYDRKVVYNYPRAPYVSLTQVPYTGLELGPVGTALYWSFLVLWCLVAAYLIVVKRVQNTILRKLNTFLFGENTPAPVTTHGGLSESELRSIAAMLRPSVEHKFSVTTSPAPMPENTETDEFILSQINRSRN